MTGNSKNLEYLRINAKQRFKKWAYITLRFPVLSATLTIVMLFQSGFSQTTASPAARISKENLKSVMTLVSLDENDQPLNLGSGFFISADGLLATNAHVIEGASKVVLRWQGKTGNATRIVKFDPRFDLVILKSSFSVTPPVKLGDSELVTVGEEVIALGNPYGLEGTVSTGIISGIRPMDDTKYLQITAPISPGSSGGPIFNDKAVIGIATASLSGGQNLNFALPSNLLRQIPNSSLSFSMAKHTSPNDTIVKDYSNLVYVNNIMENITQLGGLSGIHLSIQNKTNHTVCDFKLLVIIKNYKGETLNYRLQDLSKTEKDSCVLPGLAKQFYSSAIASGYSANAYDSLFGDPQKGSCEVRLLDFTIKRDAGSDILDQLLK